MTSMNSNTKWCIISQNNLRKTLLKRLPKRVVFFVSCKFIAKHKFKI